MSPLAQNISDVHQSHSPMKIGVFTSISIFIHDYYSLNQCLILAAVSFFSTGVLPNMYYVQGVILGAEDIAIARNIACS